MERREGGLTVGVIARNTIEVRGDFIAFRFDASTSSASYRCNSRFYCSRMADGLASSSHRRQLCTSLPSLPQRTRIHPVLRYYLHILLSHAPSINSLGFVNVGFLARQCDTCIHSSADRKTSINRGPTKKGIADEETWGLGLELRCGCEEWAA